MRSDTIAIEQFHALETELKAAEEQLHSLSELVTKKKTFFHETSSDRLALGVGCAASLVELMSLNPHVERIERRPSSLLINKGVSGHAIYGPYVKLEKGTYEIAALAKSHTEGLRRHFAPTKFSIQVAAAPSGEIYSDQSYKLGGGYEPIRLSFDVKATEQNYEFRLSTNGRDTITVERLELWRIS